MPTSESDPSARLALGSDAERLLALYLLTGPASNRLGYYVLSPGQASEDLKMPSGRPFLTRLQRVCDVFGWRYDQCSRVLWIRSWWTWNPPENPNVLTGALKDLSDVPVSALESDFAGATWLEVQRLRAAVPGCFAARLGWDLSGLSSEAPKERRGKKRGKVAGNVTGNVTGNVGGNGSGNGSPNQEQEQEQEQKELRTAAAPLAPPVEPVENSESGDLGEEPQPPAREPQRMPFQVISALVRSTLQEGTDWSYQGGEVDLVEELKSRCAKYRIHYDASAIHRALDSERVKARLAAPRQGVA